MYKSLALALLLSTLVGCQAFQTIGKGAARIALATGVALTDSALGNALGSDDSDRFEGPLDDAIRKRAAEDQRYQYEALYSEGPVEESEWLDK